MTPDPSGNDVANAEGDPTATLGRGPTRRQAITLAGGTAVALGAALGPFAHLFSAGAAEPEEPAEITLASWLVSLELAAQDVYEKFGKTDGLDDMTAALAMTCAGHHGDQAKALGSMVTAAGATAPSDPNATFADQFGLRVTNAADTPAKAAVLAEMEDGFAATYYAALGTLTSAPLAAVAAQILATDAAHGVAWSAAAQAGPDGTAMPAQDAVPVAQTAEGQFDQGTFSATTTTSAPGASTTKPENTKESRGGAGAGGPTTTTGA